MGRICLSLRRALPPTAANSPVRPPESRMPRSTSSAMLRSRFGRFRQSLHYAFSPKRLTCNACARTFGQLTASEAARRRCASLSSRRFAS
eukprot:2046846-Pleurochrysis_carterae.AAC.1